MARDLRDAGAAAVMPLGAPIGSNMGLRSKDFIQMLIDEMDLPIIVDAGIGKPSQACEAMEMGAAAVSSQYCGCNGARPGCHGGRLQAGGQSQAVKRIWQVLAGF